MVTANVPVWVPRATVMVKVLVAPPAVGTTDAGTNDGTAPLGSPAAERSTELANPLIAVRVTVKFCELPAVTVVEPGDAAILKEGAPGPERDGLYVLLLPQPAIQVIDKRMAARRI